MNLIGHVISDFILSTNLTFCDFHMQRTGLKMENKWLVVKTYMAVSLQYWCCTQGGSFQEPIRLFGQVHIHYFMSANNMISLGLFL